MARRVITVLVLVGCMKMMTASSDTVKGITESFLKVLDDCKHELNLTENILMDLYHFWKADQSLLSRDVGCAIVCMSKKLNLLDEAGKIHHGNAQKLAMSHGADEEIASKLVSAVHDCEKQHEGIDDACLRALEVAKCFRLAMQDLNWTPNLKVIVTEVLTEI